MAQKVSQSTSDSRSCLLKFNRHLASTGPRGMGTCQTARAKFPRMLELLAIWAPFRVYPKFQIPKPSGDPEPAPSYRQAWESCRRAGVGVLGVLRPHKMGPSPGVTVGRHASISQAKASNFAAQAILKIQSPTWHHRQDICVLPCLI